MKEFRCPSCREMAPLPPQPDDTSFTCHKCNKRFKISTRKKEPAAGGGDVSTKTPPLKPAPSVASTAEQEPGSRHVFQVTRMHVGIGAGVLVLLLGTIIYLLIGSDPPEQVAATEPGDARPVTDVSVPPKKQESTPEVGKGTLPAAPSEESPLPQKPEEPLPEIEPASELELPR